MKKMLVAIAIALVPVTVSPALGSTAAGASKSMLSAATSYPPICFYFLGHKICI